MQAVFVDVGADGRDLGHPVSQGIGIVSPQRGATSLALRRLDLEGLAEVFGWYQRSGVSLVTGLSPALAPGRRGRRSPLELDGGRIGGGGPGRISGVELSRACNSAIVFSNSAICLSNEPKTSRNAA